MGLSHRDVIRRYKNKTHHYARGSSVHFDGDVLESTFLGELAIRGRWGSGVEYIINGDLCPFVTHNAIAINGLRAPDRNNIVQIPFSALAAAGLVAEAQPRRNGIYSTGLDRSIKIIDTRDDRFWKVCSVCGKVVQKKPVGKKFDSYTEARAAEASGELVGWFYSRARKASWVPAHEVVVSDGSYRFKWVHADDKSDICAGENGKPGSVKEVHELGATVIRQGSRYLLSSLDYEEPRRNYFLSELPKKVQTINEAYEVLMPPPVVYAKALGREVIRQGDIFAIRSEVLTKDLTRPTKKWEHIHGTNHVATDTRYHLGRTFIRGTLRHNPAGRRPDHVMKKLGNTWWEAHRNTAKKSWQVLGRVD